MKKTNKYLIVGIFFLVFILLFANVSASKDKPEEECAEKHGYVREGIPYPQGVYIYEIRGKDSLLTIDTKFDCMEPLRVGESYYLGLYTIDSADPKPNPYTFSYDWKDYYRGDDCKTVASGGLFQGINYKKEVIFGDENEAECKTEIKNFRKYIRTWGKIQEPVYLNLPSSSACAMSETSANKLIDMQAKAYVGQCELRLKDPAAGTRKGALAQISGEESKTTEYDIYYEQNLNAPIIGKNIIKEYPLEAYPLCSITLDGGYLKTMILPNNFLSIIFSAVPYSGTIKLIPTVSNTLHTCVKPLTCKQVNNYLDAKNTGIKASCKLIDSNCEESGGVVNNYFPCAVTGYKCCIENGGETLPPILG